MNSFSIRASDDQPVLYSYMQWLRQDFYNNPLSNNNLDDPIFLQKLSLLQADSIRRDIGVNTAITSTNSVHVRETIQSAASVISSSLDNGFALMNQSMVAVNNNLQDIKCSIGNIANNIVVLNQNIAQYSIGMQHQIQQVQNVLQSILSELRIPEFLRERRYHIEKGLEFLKVHYYEDALDEFSKAISIEKKDFLSWYYIGMIHLYSVNHLDIDKALDAFNQYTHYASVLTKRHELFDEALIMIAECYYLKQNMDKAYFALNRIQYNFNVTKIKVDLLKMKYLSASETVEHQREAVGILKTLMTKNPYVVMQVLEDYDIVSNTLIIQYLNEFRINTKKDIIECLTLCDSKKDILRDNIAYYDNIQNKLDEFKKQINIDDNGIVELVELKRQLQAMKMSEKIYYAEKVAPKIKAKKEAKKQFQEQLLKKRQYLKSQGYIDLGLPSGTLWKNKNESGLYGYDDACQAFGEENIPSLEKWEELKKECKWSRVSFFYFRGLRGIGPNGNSIFLPANGYRYGTKWTSLRHKVGKYLSNDKSGDSKHLMIAWFNSVSDGFGIKSESYLIRCSVRKAF